MTLFLSIEFVKPEKQSMFGNSGKVQGTFWLYDRVFCRMCLSVWFALFALKFKKLCDKRISYFLAVFLIGKCRNKTPR